MSKTYECDLASDVVKSVNISAALKWVALAWNGVKFDIITKCFKKAGTLNYLLEVVGWDQAGVDGSLDTFADSHDLELQHLTRGKKV